ncbi:MAG: efflux transporter outer membrane subunit [Afipia sp.]|nr:efflux transporter outer membrane subunit [Afipia sp.]
MLHNQRVDRPVLLLRVLSCPADPSRSRRLVGIGSALMLAALSAGCIVTADVPNAALDVPDIYKSASPIDSDETPPSLDWWRAFRSPELTVLMEEAQRVNLDIAAATARIVQADALASEAGAALLPSVTGGFSGSRSRSSKNTGVVTTGSSVGGRTEVTNHVAQLNASYEIDFWGKNRDALLAAEETANSNRFDRDVVALTTLASVANAYFTVVASQDRLRIAQNNIASAQRIYNAIKSRVDAGTNSDLDLAQQESVLNNQKALVPPLKQTLDQNANVLAVLVARPPERVRLTGASLSQIGIPRVTPGLPSELLIQRPDIRRQENQLASATANVGSARAQFFPSIQLTGSGGYQSAALMALFVPQSAFFNMAAGLTQPIFDAGKIQANFDYNKAKQDELLQTYRKTVVQAFSDVDTALVAIRQTTEKLRLQRNVVISSRRAFELSERQLRAGTADIVTVLNTQLTLFQAEDSLAQAQLARLQAIVSLYQALGGGWSPRTEPKTEEKADAL